MDHLLLQYKLQQEKEKMNLKSPAQNGLTFYGYNISAAVNYALTYALDPNPHYWNYEKWGGDCTNFTSQCLHAGKIPLDKSGIDVTLWWYWLSDYNRTPSWTAAAPFQYYITHNNKDPGSVSIGLKGHPISWQELLRGDIIQLINPNNGYAYHSMICTDYIVENGYVTDYLVSQHSGYDEDHSRRLRNYPLSLKDGVKIFWSIDGYFNCLNCSQVF